MRFADTNIFLRYLVQPVTEIDQTRAEACRELFERVSIGVEEITTSEAVLAEIVYVLASRRQYGLVPSDVVARLKSVVALPGLKIAQKRLYLHALDIYTSHRRLTLTLKMQSRWLSSNACSQLSCIPTTPTSTG